MDSQKLQLLLTQLSSTVKSAEKNVKSARTLPPPANQVNAQNAKPLKEWELTQPIRKNVQLAQIPTVRPAPRTQPNVRTAKTTSTSSATSVLLATLHVAPAQPPTFVPLASQEPTTWTAASVRPAQLDVPPVRTIDNVPPAPQDSSWVTTSSAPTTAEPERSETNSQENARLAQLTAFLAPSQENVTLASTDSTSPPLNNVPPAEPTAQAVTPTEDAKLASTILISKTTEPAPRNPGTRSGGFGY